MTKTKKEQIKAVALKTAAKAKTANELNCIIAKYIDAFDQGKIKTAEQVKTAEILSGFIGRQVSVENTKISYERLASWNNKKYAFAS